MFFQKVYNGFGERKEFLMDYNVMVGNKIKSYLDSNDMSQSRLAKTLGVSAQSVTNWITGAKLPRMDKIDSMCEVFGCTRNDLIGESSITIETIDVSELSAENRKKALVYIYKLLELQRMEEGE